MKDNQHQSALSRLELAQQMLESLVEHRPVRQPDLVNLGSTYWNLALLHTRAKQLEQAAAAQQRTLDIRRQLHADDPQNPTHQFGLVAALQLTGLTALKDRRYAESAEAYEEALGIIEGLIRKFPQIERYRRDAGRILRARGIGARQAGVAVEAVTMLHRAENYFEELRRKKPQNTEYLYDH